MIRKNSTKSSANYYSYGGSFDDTSFSQALQSFYKNVKYHTNEIQSICDRLDIIPESPAITLSVAIPEDPEVSLSNEVFIVHGHDELAKQTVARFIEKLDLKAIILHEQTSQGRTIIEKFESFSNMGFAVILLTPDDVGMSQDAYKKSQQLNERARQNVVFEHGFFIGKFGRHRVCALVKGGVETPSDLQGIIYIPLDEQGAWQLPLAREMKASGMVVDLNKAF